jgi:hypothetical protein
MFNSDNVEFEVIDHVIKGKMVKCSMTIPDYKIHSMDPAYKMSIKQEMATRIAHFLLDNNMIDYTQMPNYQSLDINVYARCFVTPDETVRILRTLKR